MLRPGRTDAEALLREPLLRQELRSLQVKQITLVPLERVEPTSYRVPGKFCLKDPVIDLLLVYSRNGQRHGCVAGCSDQYISGSILE